MKKRTDAILPYGGNDETTRELTGRDANMDQAQVSDAGSGADPYGADMTGGFPTPIDDQPEQRDIAPDLIEDWPGQAVTEERELTAQPTERPPVDPSELT